MNTGRSVIIGKYFLYENALKSKASLVRDKIRVEKYTFHVRPAVKMNLKQNGVPFILCLRCFDTVSQRPYRCFSIVLKVICACPIATNFSPVIDYELKFVKMQFLVKIDITMTTVNKKL